MYCQKKSPDPCTDLNDPLRVGEYGLEQMFADNGVDVAYWGHIHLYQRSYPGGCHGPYTKCHRIYVRQRILWYY